MKKSEDVGKVEKYFKEILGKFWKNKSFLEMLEKICRNFNITFRGKFYWSFGKKVVSLKILSENEAF